MHCPCLNDPSRMQIRQQKIAFFCKQIPNWSLSEEESWGCQLLKNLALSIWEAEKEGGGLCREGKLPETQWNRSADFTLRCISLLLVTKSSANLFVRNERLGVNHLLIFTVKLKRRKGTACFILLVFSSDDEHLLIQHYCQSLNQESPLSQPRSPAQILISLESEERGELERILSDLEEENRWVMPPAAECKVKIL